MTERTHITERLLSWCIDWNGAPMVDGEEPRIIPRVRDLRDASDEIARLERDLASARAEVVSLTKYRDGLTRACEMQEAENERLRARVTELERELAPIYGLDIEIPARAPEQHGRKEGK